jgi:hypothetical protein
MATKYTNFVFSNALQNIPKSGFFGLRIYHLATLSIISPLGAQVNGGGVTVDVF